MATWKRLATYVDEESNVINASITGTAHGGFAQTPLPMEKGGTGVDTDDWNDGSMVMYSGGAWTTIASPGGANQMLVSQGSSSWEWKDISDSHSHSGYLQVADNSGTPQTFQGSMHILGALSAEQIEVAEFETIDAGTGSQITLNTSGGAGNGANCGMVLSVDDPATDLQNGDPAILWNATAGRWDAGAYNTSMQSIGLVVTGDVNPAVGPEMDGLIGTNSSTGNIYVSIT